MPPWRKDRQQAAADSRPQERSSVPRVTRQSHQLGNFKHEQSALSQEARGQGPKSRWWQGSGRLCASPLALVAAGTLASLAYNCTPAPCSSMTSS